MKKNNFCISKKIIVVTGGSGQVGKNLIKFLLEKKSIVINLDLNNYKNLKRNYHFLKTDFSDEKSVIKSILDIKKKFKKIDSCINLFHFKGGSRLTPGHPFFSSFHNYPTELWEKTILTNLNGLFFVTREVVKLMLKKKLGGTIVNFSSTYGVNSPNYKIYGSSGINNPIAYATTKSAIINFTKYLATHYAKKNIRVNTISPGGIENKNQTKSFKDKYSELTPMGRLAKPNEFNEAVLYLISDASSYTTGSNILVDGGWTAW